MKLFVGIPARDGHITAATAISLYEEQDLAKTAGVEIALGILPGCSVLHCARDQVVRNFLASDADKLIFVDDDVSWEAGSLLKLASHPVDFVGGAYRFKKDAEAYPVQWLKDRKELWADPETGLLEVLTLPTGFMSLSRKVIATFIERRPRIYRDDKDLPIYAFFQAPFGGSEDTAFCLEWRELGGQVWLDPELRLGHHGGLQMFDGHIGNWLKGRPHDGA
jgi:hypothetical protein